MQLNHMSLRIMRNWIKYRRCTSNALFVLLILKIG
jgi:hypothetical protein